MKQFKLKVANAVKKTDLSKELTFLLSDDIVDEFKYFSGQYIGVAFEEIGLHNVRTYSLTTSPNIDKNLISICIKSVRGGLVSNFINDKVKIGDEVIIYPPNGKFFINPYPQNAKNYIFFSGGSGITPIFSMIKSILSIETQSTAVLFFGNFDESNIIYRQEFEELEKLNSTRFKLFHILSNPSTDWQGKVGLMTKEVIIDLIKSELNDDYINPNNEFYMCGPGPMMDNVQEALDELSIEKTKIYKENYTAFPIIQSESNIGLVKKVNAILVGSEKEFEVQSNEFILFAAEKAGLHPPSMCRSGICGTCKAKLIEGDISMQSNDVLDEFDIKEGYRLTCIGKPIRDVVKINWDVL